MEWPLQGIKALHKKGFFGNISPGGSANMPNVDAGSFDGLTEHQTAPDQRAPETIPPVVVAAPGQQAPETFPPVVVAAPGLAGTLPPSGMAANRRKSSSPPDSLELLSERMKSLSDRISLITWAILIIITIFGLIANLLLNRIAGVETALGNRMDRLDSKFDSMAETLKQIQIDNAKWQASLDMLLKNPAPYREVPRSPEAPAATGGSPGQNPQPESGQAEPAQKLAA
jgi:hypothetical protein